MQLHRDSIIKKLRDGISVKDIATSLNVTKSKLSHIINRDAHLFSIISELRFRSFDNNTSDIENEIWRDIIGYDHYQISNFGRVRRYVEKYKRYRILKPATSSVLYPQVALSKDGIIKSFRVHNLVAVAFVDGRSEVNNVVNHIDGNKCNNNAINLEWVTHSYNVQHSINILGRRLGPVSKYGAFSSIIIDDLHIFKTIKSACNFLNVDRRTFYAIVEGKSRRKYKIEFR